MKAEDINEELLRINTILYSAWAGLKMDTPLEQQVHEARCAVHDLRMKMAEKDEEAQRPLADYIVEWLISRNRGELAEAFGNMKVRDSENLKSELRWILMHGGHPPNWVPR